MWRDTAKMDEILVEKIIEKEGATDGRAWTRYGVKDGNGEWYSTFEQSVVAGLKEGEKARIQYESKQVNGRVVKNLLAAEPFEESSISSRTDEGDPDWDLIGLRKTRCALWADYLAGQLAASLYVKAAGTQGRDPIDYLVTTGVRLVVAAERDIFNRDPGDDGIPFDFDEGAPR
jgi:hypothetical protein